MQSLARVSRLPRLLMRARVDTLGGLRPGHDHTANGNKYGSALSARRDCAGRTRSGSSGPARPARKTRLPLGWIALTVCVGLALAVLNLPPSMQGDARNLIDRIAVAAGFSVDHVAIVGHNRTSIRDISAALDLDTDKSLFGLGADEVRRKLRRLPWVRNVRVVHILPDMISIEIIERTPFAIWQYRGKRILVDKSGHHLGPVNQVPDLTFPLVVGRGAETAAGGLLDKLAKHPVIARNVSAAIRIADRRWNLQFRSGKKILLPESGMRTALTTLDVLLADKDLRIDELQLIDLRIPERPTVRLMPRAVDALVQLRKTRRAGRQRVQGGAT